MKKKSKAKKKKAVASSGSKLKVANLKINGKDRKALTLNAKKYANGNLSAWLRHAGLKYAPKKGEKIISAPIYK